jgi:hypothetical protein
MARGAIVLLVLLVTVGDLSANEVRDISLEKKARQSDLVVIGRVESTRPENLPGGTFEYARVHVDQVLKGKPPDRLDVLTKGSITELDPDCCEVGNVYLFFLVKEKWPNRFESVHGRYGIYLIPRDRPVSK